MHRSSSGRARRGNVSTSSNVRQVCSFLKGRVGAAAVANSHLQNADFLTCDRICASAAGTRKKMMMNKLLALAGPANRKNDFVRGAFHVCKLCGQDRRRSSMSEGEMTTSHNFIRKWADQRDGHPATVKDTAEDGHAGILRIDFGPKEERLEEIGWDEFFRKFDEAGLAFLYQERTKDGKLSRFHKFVRRSAA
jgi:hypothetical protein